MSYSNNKYISVDGDDTKRLPIDHALHKENYFRFEYYYYRLYYNFAGARLRLLPQTRIQQRQWHTPGL